MKTLKKKFMKKIMKTLAISVSLLSAPLALGDSVNWQSVGITEESCAFQGQLDLLPGYPFARFIWKASQRNKVIPLSISEEDHCQWAQYLQTPPSEQAPTFEVFGEFLCMGRLPQYTVTLSLSGARHTCILARE